MNPQKGCLNLFIICGKVWSHKILYKRIQLFSTTVCQWGIVSYQIQSTKLVALGRNKKNHSSKIYFSIDFLPLGLKLWGPPLWIWNVDLKIILPCCFKPREWGHVIIHSFVAHLALLFLFFFQSLILNL